MKKFLKIVGIIVLVIAGLFAFVFWATRGVSAGADTFFQALETGNTDAAYALTSSGFKEATPPEQWSEFTGIYDLGTITSHAWTSWSAQLGGTGTVGGTITRQDNTVWDTEVELVKEEDLWKVEYFNIDLREEAAAQ